MLVLSGNCNVHYFNCFISMQQAAWFLTVCHSSLCWAARSGWCHLKEVSKNLAVIARARREFLACIQKEEQPKLHLGQSRVGDETTKCNNCFSSCVPGGMCDAKSDAFFPSELPEVRCGSAIITCCLTESNLW